MEADTRHEMNSQSQASRIPGQVCDRCRRRKIRCRGTGLDCEGCLAAGVVCVTAAKLKRNRKRKGFYESEGIEKRRTNSASYSTPDPYHGLQVAQQALSPGSDPRSVPSVPHGVSPRNPSDVHLTTQPSSAATAVPSRTTPRRDPVIGHMGFLVHDANQVAMFGGSSTGVYFISQAEQQLQAARAYDGPFPQCTYGLHLHDLWGVSSRGHSLSSDTEMILALVAQLPPDVDDILSVAVDRWTPLYPAIHKPSIMASLQDLRDGSTAAHPKAVVALYQVFGLLALGAIGSAGSCPRTHLHFICRSESYYAMAAALLDKALAHPCLEVLQGLVIIQIYLQLSSRYSVASHIGGVAVRLAQSLGLHRHSQRFKFDPLEAEMRRRTWWCQNTLDAFSSAYHGVPRLVRDADVDTDQPTRVDHGLLSTSHVSFPLPGEGSQVDTALRLFQIGRILGCALEQLYTTTQRRGGLAKIARLQADLDMWERSLPHNPSLASRLSDDFDPTDGDLPDAISLPDMFVYTAFCAATIHVHRPAMAFTAPDPQISTSLSACAGASASLIRLLSSPADDKSDDNQTHTADDQISTMITALLYPNGAHMLWQAGLTLLYAHCKGQSKGDEASLVRRCAGALRRLHRATDDAEAYLVQAAEVLERLAQKTFPAVEGNEVGEGPVSQLEVMDEHMLWNVWDWPMTEALELANTMGDTLPWELGLQLESVAWP